MITIHQRHRRTDGRTDRQTTCDRNTALCTKVHRAVKTTLQRQVVKNTYMYFGFWLRTWNCVNQKQPSPFMNFGHWFIQQLLKLPNKPKVLLLEIRHCRQLDSKQGVHFNTNLLLRQRERTYASSIKSRDEGQNK